MNRWCQFLPLLVLFAGGTVGCSAINPTTPRTQDQVVTAAPANQPAVAQPTPNPPTNIKVNLAEANYIAQVVQAVGGSVVRINSVRQANSGSENSDLRRFLGGGSGDRAEVIRGSGSGFIISQDGQILTNAHVVNGADQVTVVLKDGRRLQGRVLGADSVTDVAVVKINATGLPVAKLGNSDQILPGQAAIAIGNPLGLNNTVTQGIISATGRSSSDLGVPDRRIDYLQTDAAINPGNSGGPLLNASGEVIGVNTAIIQGAQGLGFAIPINSARRIAEQLIATGKVEHPYLGIQMTELTPEVQQQINQSNSNVKINRDQGVVIVGVVRNSPAAQAGLRPGDIIEQVNGAAIDSSTQVQQKVDQTGLGKTLQMTISRNGQSQQISLQPKALPQQQEQG